MDIGIIGTGNMGRTLGEIWASREHKILFGSRDPAKGREAAAQAGHEATSGSYADAVQFGRAVLLATPWWGTPEAILEAGSFQGKILIDCTNPLLPDYSGLALGFDTSGAEEIARAAAGARVVKAFNAIGFKNLRNPFYGPLKADAYYCGDDPEAKLVVAELAREVGLEPIDAGPLQNARLLEPLAMLWVYEAFNQNLADTSWKLLRR
ncbi:MAG: F420-dependent NADP oxidoreductase [Candidatus Zixiibacteriota bacterium]|nr:MAG: F420-dependent NADP oxidoreductase [candidate division Zixibacteria bacterium]